MGFNETEHFGEKSACPSVCVLSHSVSRVWLFATLWTVAHQAPLSKGIF